MIRVNTHYKSYEAFCPLRNHTKCAQSTKVTLQQQNYHLMETVRRKKKRQFSLLTLSSTTNGVDARDDFFTDHPLVDWYKTTQEERHSRHFFKRIGFGLDDYHFWECRFTQMLWVYEWLDQKWQGIHLLFVSKNDINSVLKIPVANFSCLITPQLILGMADGSFLKFQLCIVCRYKFSWIEFHITSGTV